MKFKKILVTGGAGYVGAMLTENLLKNSKVDIYDTLF